MHKGLIIGISGKIGSGKDTLAELINKSSKGRFERKSFAYKLKKIGCLLTGTEEYLWFTQEGKNTYLPDWEMTIGEFQQKLGTECIRNNLHMNGWVISLFADLKPDSKWLITDMRFPNEAAAVKKVGGITIRIEGDPAGVRAESKRDLNHQSETSLDNYKDWDYTFNNNGTLEQLQVFADYVLLMKSPHLL